MSGNIRFTVDPVMLGKLPQYFRINITRENGSHNWMIAKLRDSISRELAIQESGKTDYSYSSRIVTYTANFVAGVSKNYDKNSTCKTSKFVNKQNH